MKRKIVHIDEEKCNGCGECVPSCAEGAIQVVDGKAKLVSDVYCDGLGACLGECPQGAIEIIERDAPEFDEEAAKDHVKRVEAMVAQALKRSEHSSGCPGSQARTIKREAAEPLKCGCPGSMARTLDRPQRTPCCDSGPEESQLGQWPVQLTLVPPNAPYFQNADLLLVADCVPFALAGFHKRFLKGKAVVIGCPKLDDSNAYVDKLAAILEQSSINSLKILHMEVPCCTGLLRIASAAIEKSGKDLPVSSVTVTLDGDTA